MRSEKLLSAIGGIGEDLIEDAEITSNKKSRQPIWWKIVAVAACICLVIAVFPLLGNQEKGVNLNPLVISVYAQGADGKIVPTALKLGEKVKMSPASSTQLEDFDGYAINLTLFDGKYVYLRCVDKNWKTLLFPTDVYPDTKLEYNWAETEGDDIWIVYLDSDGKVIPPEADNLLTPKRKGSDFIWRPNDKDMNRAIIGVFDEEYDLLTVYYLEITEENSEYYAEVVKISNELPSIS